MPSVLITGGNGRTARNLIETLFNLPNCPTLRVLVRSGGIEPLKQALPLLASAPHSIVLVDYMDERTLMRAFHDVAIVVHNGPAVHQQEAVRCPLNAVDQVIDKHRKAMATAVIDAAKHAGVRHFILCSVLHPMRTKLVTHKLKLQ